jgi:PKHD-type hydroxylase|tara:strand:+ start:3081 stop:3719 length:639 start_codon:yes stop_codon:yes gene_type:complete
MNLKHYYWYFKSALPPKLCDDIIRYALSKNESMARTGGFDDQKPLSQDQILDLKKKRNSDLVWLDETWIYKELHPYVKVANKNAGWNFEWDASEQIQFTKYKINQYYDWHCDSWKHPYNKPRNNLQHGKIRKISMTCQLTDGSEYKGGELEFDFRNYDPHMRDESIHKVQCKEILPKGSIIVFPSHVWHRVKPVTAGTRYSLVMWNLGQPWK